VTLLDDITEPSDLRQLSHPQLAVLAREIRGFLVQHKIVTGRAHRFAELRRRGGLSGYPSRTESPHDHIEHSHASAALSYADGMAKARELSGETDRHIVAVVGDGALTGWPGRPSTTSRRRPNAPW
jgi:1-deoxy-D-xylulose-5-phosphate synthase